MCSRPVTPLGSELRFPAWSQQTAFENRTVVPLGHSDIPNVLLAHLIHSHAGAELGKQREVRELCTVSSLLCSEKGNNVL